MSEEYPNQRVTIYINNRPFKVRSDIPLGAALYEAGIYAIEKSMRFNRPRGLMVYDWRGPEKIYIEGEFEDNPYFIKPYEGMRINIRLDKPFPSPIMKLFKRYLKVGGHDKWPFNRLWAWNMALKYIDKMLPWNKPRYLEKPPDKYPEYIEVSTDILVIGGGISGLTAAYSASKKGLKVVLVESESCLGGHSKIYEIDRFDDKWINNILHNLKENNVNILLNTIFQGFFEDAAFGYKVDTGQTILFKYKSIIFSNGSYEIPALYENNDLPRTMLTSAILKLIKFYNVKPGNIGVVVGSTYHALKTALILHKNNVSVKVIESSFKGYEYEALKKVLIDEGIEIYDNISRVIAVGDDYIKGIKILRDEEWININASFIAMAPYITPDIKLLKMAKLELIFDIDLGGYVPVHSIDGCTYKDNMFIAGSVGGVIPEKIYSLFSYLAGFKAAEYLGKSLDKDYDHYLDEGTRLFKNNYPKLYKAFKKIDESYHKGDKYINYDGSAPTLYDGDPSKIFICYCTDVTLEDLEHIINDLKLYRMEHIKRYSGIATGRCQGKRCLFNAILLSSKLSNKRPDEIGTIRFRPPYIPMPLYSLGGVESEV